MEDQSNSVMRLQTKSSTQQPPQITINPVDQDVASFLSIMALSTLTPSVGVISQGPVSYLPLELLEPLRQVLGIYRSNNNHHYDITRSQFSAENEAFAKNFLASTRYLLSFGIAAVQPVRNIHNNAFLHFPTTGRYNTIFLIPVVVKIHKNYNRLFVDQFENNTNNTQVGLEATEKPLGQGIKVLVLGQSSGSASFISNGISVLGRDLFSEFRKKIRKSPDPIERNAPFQTISLVDVSSMSQLSTSTRSRFENQDIFCVIADVASLQRLVEAEKNSYSFPIVGQDQNVVRDEFGYFCWNRRKMFDFSGLDMIVINEAHLVLANPKYETFINSIVAPIAKKCQIIVSSQSASQPVVDFCGRFIPRALSVIHNNNNNNNKIHTNDNASICLSKTFVAIPPSSFMVKCYGIPVHDDANVADYFAAGADENSKSIIKVVLRNRKVRELVTKIRQQEKEFASRQECLNYSPDDQLQLRYENKYQILIRTTTNRSLLSNLVPLIRMLPQKIIGNFEWIDTETSTAPNGNNNNNNNTFETTSSIGVRAKVALFQKGAIDILACNDIGLTEILLLGNNNNNSNDGNSPNCISLDRPMFDEKTGKMKAILKCHFILINYDDVVHPDHMMLRISPMLSFQENLLERFCVLNLVNHPQSANTQNQNENAARLNSKSLQMDIEESSQLSDRVSDWFPSKN